MTQQLLIDTIVFNPQILEDGNSDGIMRISGVFQRSDTKNANMRQYPRRLWEKALNSSSPVMTKIKERGMIGQLEHPADGVTDLRKGAIVVTGLSLDESGDVIGTAELLDTPDGKIAQEYVRKNVRIGVSSRGKGTVGADGKVSEDYVLETFDLVYNPSTLGAHPTKVVDDPAKNESSNTAESRVSIQAFPTEKEEPIMSLNVTENFKKAEGRVKMLVETEVQGMPQYQLSDLDGKLVETSVQLGQLSAANPELRDLVSGLQKQVNEKRAHLDELTGGRGNSGTQVPYTVRTIIAENAESDEGDDLNESGENEEVLDELEGAIEEGEEVQEASEQLFEAMQERLQEANAENEHLHALLEAAVALISELTARDVEGEIEQAIESVLENNPHFEGAVEILKEATSVEEVFEKAEQLGEVLGGYSDHEDEDEEGFEDHIGEESDDEEAERKAYDDNDIARDVDGNEVEMGESFLRDLDGIDSILESEEDVSKGLLETVNSGINPKHKGSRLVEGALARIVVG